MTGSGDPVEALPQVTVIMAAHNAEAYVGRALRSLQAQTFRDFEVVVVDDASTDGTAQVVAGMDDPRVVLVHLTANVGPAAARNVALKRARAPLVAVLDADDVAWPQRLEAQVAFLAAHPEVDVLGGQIRVIDQNGRVLGRRLYPLGHSEIVRSLPRLDPLAHSTVTARTAVVRAAGGYPPLPQSQDYALWCVLARRDAVFANLPLPLCDYRVHPQSMKHMRTRQTLRRTIAIQRQYYPVAPTPRDAAYRALEHVLLLLPAPALYAVFDVLRYRVLGLTQAFSRRSCPGPAVPAARPPAS
jgi:glycosyltransferase involved in cell wall biosynthesis